MSEQSPRVLKYSLKLEQYYQAKLKVILIVVAEAKSYLIALQIQKNSIEWFIVPSVTKSLARKTKVPLMVFQLSSISIR